MGSSFTEGQAKDDIQVVFRPDSGLGVDQLVVIVAAVVVTYLTAGAASEMLVAAASESATAAATAAGATAAEAAAAGTAAASAAAASVSTAMISSAAGAMASSAVTGALTGNFSMDNVLKAGVSGAIFGGINGYYGNSWSFERLAANATAGGISARMQGADFATGFTDSLLTGAAKWMYVSQVGFGPNPLPGENQPGKTTYAFDENGRQLPDTIRMNVVGLNTGLTRDFWDDLGKQGGFLSQAANLIPGINATAALHDYWFNNPDHLDFTLLKETLNKS